MKSFTSQEVKNTFLQYMKKNNHLKIPGASIIPNNDPTLLFINAGMAPMKRYFSGLDTPPYSDLCNIQPCIRTIDIDDVGDMHHLTMFEMLGSWSINNYFKQKSIELAYDLLSNHYGFSKDKLYATVYGGNEQQNIPADTESMKLWGKVGLPNDHIVMLKEDNFWSAGDTGPCGPCTEVFFDTGDKYVKSYHETGEFDTKNRYVEIWNAGVFMQYNKKTDGSLENLPFKSVDTGAGLERLTMALNSKDSVYDIDVFKPYMDIVNSTIGIETGEKVRASRIIADHIRTATMIMSEGIYPGKDGRNYIPRKLIRRSVTEAMLYTEVMDFKALANIAIAQLSVNYPIVKSNATTTLNFLDNEILSFQKNLKQGMKNFYKLTKNSKTLTGQQIFNLHSSSGMPIELLTGLAKKTNIVLDLEDYKKLFAEHRNISKSGISK